MHPAASIWPVSVKIKFPFFLDHSARGSFPLSFWAKKEEREEEVEEEEEAFS